MAEPCKTCGHKLIEKSMEESFELLMVDAAAATAVAASANKTGRLLSNTMSIVRLLRNGNKAAWTRFVDLNLSELSRLIMLICSYNNNNNNNIS